MIEGKKVVLLFISVVKKLSKKHTINYYSEKKSDRLKALNDRFFLVSIRLFAQNNFIDEPFNLTYQRGLL